MGRHVFTDLQEGVALGFILKEVTQAGGTAQGMA